MFAIGIKNVDKFDFLDRPPLEAIESAIRKLKLLSAINNDKELTELGRKMAAFPLDPRFTKMIFSAQELGCT